MIDTPEIAITTRSLAAVQAIHRFGAELLSHGCHASVNSRRSPMIPIARLPRPMPPRFS